MSKHVVEGVLPDQLAALCKYSDASVITYWIGGGNRLHRVVRIAHSKPSIELGKTVFSVTFFVEEKTYPREAGEQPVMSHRYMTPQIKTPSSVLDGIWEILGRFPKVVPNQEDPLEEELKRHIGDRAMHCNVCDKSDDLTLTEDLTHCDRCFLPLDSDGWPKEVLCPVCSEARNLLVRQQMSESYLCVCGYQRDAHELGPIVQAQAAQIQKNRAMCSSQDGVAQALALGSGISLQTVVCCVRCDSNDLRHADGEATCGDCGSRMTSLGELIPSAKLKLGVCQLCREAIEERGERDTISRSCSSCKCSLDEGGYPNSHKCNLCETGRLVRRQGEEIVFACTACDNQLAWNDLRPMMLSLLTTGQLKRIKFHN